MDSNLTLVEGRERACVFSSLWGRGWELTVSPSKCVHSLAGYLHVFKSMVTHLKEAIHLDLQEGHLELGLEKACDFVCFKVHSNKTRQGLKC